MFSSDNSDCETAESLSPCYQLLLYEVILGLQILRQNSCEKKFNLERSQVRQKYSREMFNPGVEVPWGPCADASTFTHVQMQTQRITLLSASCSPGGVISLWVACWGLCSGRPFVTDGLTNHSSFRHKVSVSVHRDSTPAVCPSLRPIIRVWTVFNQNIQLPDPGHLYLYICIISITQISCVLYSNEQYLYFFWHRWAQRNYRYVRVPSSRVSLFQIIQALSYTRKENNNANRKKHDRQSC